MKLYWKMYQDKNSIKYTSVILTKKEMEMEVNGFFERCEEDLAPVFEPIMMEEKEFEKLPEFKGF